MKKLALLLLTAMLVQCLSGCGSSAPSKERPSHDIPQTPVSSDTQPEEPPEPEPYELDLEDLESVDTGQYILTFSAPNPGAQPIGGQILRNFLACHPKKTNFHLP